MVDLTDLSHAATRHKTHKRKGALLLPLPTSLYPYLTDCVDWLLERWSRLPSWTPLASSIDIVFSFHGTDSVHLLRQDDVRQVH